MNVNLNELANLTGKTYRTVKKRLSGISPVEMNAQGIFYNSIEALPLLYGIDGDEGFDLSKERARLARLQADAQDLKNKLMRGEIIYADKVKNDAQKTGTMIRTALQAVPNKVAPLIIDLTTPAEVAAVLNHEVNQILSKLADEIKRV